MTTLQNARQAHRDSHQFPTIAECIASGHLVSIQQPSNSSPMKNQTARTQDLSIPVATSATHTPTHHDVAAITSGQWKEQTSVDGMIDIISGTNFICRVGSSEFPAVRHDARLIAAAPTLLALHDKHEAAIINLHCALQSTAHMDPNDNRIPKITGQIIADLLKLAREARAAIQSATL